MKRTYLTLIIAMLVIGFAAVATNLVINGTINFGFNQNDFDSNVVFTYTNTMNGTATIQENGKAIIFNTTKLENVNQQAIMDFDIANKSKQYDASVTIECGLEQDDRTYEEYLKIEQNLGDEAFYISSGDTKSGRLTITLTKAYNESLVKDINMVCEIIATAGERNTEGTYTPVVHQYEEILLHGADPVLEATPVEGISLTAELNQKKLIPVKIDDDGTVTRADTTKEWYDYENQWWANAVILNDEIAERDIDEEIQEENIESYFVWIPKYKYRLWNVNVENPTHAGPFAIEIEFGTEDTTDNENECVAPNKSGETDKCENGKWMTHPAFTSFDVNGFWVGKFEVGYRGANSKEEALKNEESSTNIIVKPNVFSWRDMTNKNMFTSLKGYATSLDSHMMKNTEWGAVAYLSHSIYGINDEIAQNTEPNYKTGYAKTDDGIAEYNSLEGVKASTTGNITGIYDMSGGAWERMAAYRDVNNTNEKIGLSEFTKEDIEIIDKKYFDIYESTSTASSYNKRILGDATGEMGPFINSIGSWYKDYGGFVNSDSPWLGRGDQATNDSTNCGQFFFQKAYGGTSTYGGSRLVLSPQ